MIKTPNTQSTDIAKPAPNSGMPKADPDEPNTKKTSKEIGGREGLDPTRYGDWEKAGRCVDF